jgi:hypothetical protein
VNKENNLDFYQEFEQNQPVQKPKQGLPAQKSFLKKVKAGDPKSVALFALIITTVLLVSLTIVISQLPKPAPPAIQPTPTPVAPPPPTPYLSNPSKYATDSVVLQTENDLVRILDDLQKVDLKEDDLTPPQIDTAVAIQ